MRSDEGAAGIDCDDEMTQLACEMGSDECPAACRDNGEEEEEDKVVKSGDLYISAEANKGASVISKGATSELDTLTFKASEDITLDSITLERYGLSKYNSVAFVWLENQDGVKITSEKSVSSSKDTVTLSIKKDHKSIKNGDSVIVVVSTPNSPAADLGTNIGFKVVAAEASAKNLDLSDYAANLYDIIDYVGNSITVTSRGSDKVYNYEEGESYEIAKLKIAASNAAVKVNGFTLTQAAEIVEAAPQYKASTDTSVTDGKTYYDKGAACTTLSTSCDGANTYSVIASPTGNPSTSNYYELNKAYVAPVVAGDLDLNEYIDSIEVLVDGVAVKNVSYTTKRDELKVSFDDQEIGINKNSTFTVNATLKGFDEFNSVIRLELSSISDVNAYESKNSVRVSVKTPLPSLAIYTFKGGKITLTNTKLASTIDAAAGSDDVVVAEGSIAIAGQTLRLDEFTLTPTLEGVSASGLTREKLIESLKLSIDGEEYEADNAWKFKDITIDNDSKVKVLVDLYDVDTKGDIITVSFDPAMFNSTSLAALKYDDVKNAVSSVSANGRILGSISISKLKVQPSKGSITNSLSKKVEFKVKETTSDKVLLDGTYKAKKNNVRLNSATIALTAGSLPAGSDVTFHLYIDGTEVASFDGAESQDFAEIAVEAGESVPVKVTADVYAASKTNAAQNLVYEISLDGDDDNGNPAGTASEPLVDMAFVDAESITVSSKVGFNKQDLVLADKDQTVAKFTVKPGNKADSANLDEMTIDLGNTYVTLIESLASKSIASVDAEDYFRVKIGGDDAENLSFVAANAGTDAACAAGYDPHDEDGDTVKETCKEHGGSTIDANKVTTPAVLPTPAKLKITDINEDINSNGADVEVVFKKELTAAKTDGTDYKLTLSSVNKDTTVSREFDRKAVKALIRVVSQEGEKAANTTYKFEIDFADSVNSETITSLSFTYANNIVALGSTPTMTWSNVQEGETYNVSNNESANYLNSITYVDGDGNSVTVRRVGSDPLYPDFFKVDGTTKDIQAYANK